MIPKTPKVSKTGYTMPPCAEDCPKCSGDCETCTCQRYCGEV